MSRLQVLVIFSSALLTLAAAESLWAAETYLSMPATVTYGHALTPDHALEGSIVMAPRAEINYQTHRFVVSARLHADVEDFLEPGRPELSNYTSLSRPWQFGSWGRLELRDAFLEVPFGRHQIRVGKQQIVWGGLDGIKLLDVLNPQNFREFILEEFDESRIGLWSVYLDLLLGRWRSELVVIPDTTAHEIPDSGAWFELLAPRFRFGATREETIPNQATQRPDVRDGTVAGRISRSVGPFDLALQAVSGIDFEPLGRLVLNEGQPLLERYYERRQLFGLQAETAIGGMVVRMEASYQPDRSFNTRTPAELASTGLDQLRVAVGLDVDGPFGVFFNLQYLHDQVMSAPASLVRPPIDRVLTVFARRQLAHDTLALEIRWYGELETGDGMARASVQYQLGADTRLRLAGDFFYGAPAGIFGQFEGQDRVVLSLEHTF